MSQPTTAGEAPTPHRANNKRAGNANSEDCEHDADDRQSIFPQRLMMILSDEKRHAAAICWLPHGRSFIIRDRELFAETVMPKFFSRKSKYSSFTRKLNRWNFARVSSGPEIGAYHHEFFLRDRPQLAAQMFCKNARTKLAMNMPDRPAPSAEAAIPMHPFLPGAVDARFPLARRLAERRCTRGPMLKTAAMGPSERGSFGNNNNNNDAFVHSQCMRGLLQKTAAMGLYSSNEDNSNNNNDAFVHSVHSQCMRGLLQKTAAMGLYSSNEDNNNNGTGFASNNNKAGFGGGPFPDMAAAAAASCSPLAVQRHIEAQKQQQQHLIQLQMLARMQQQRRQQQQRSKNFRASAA